MTVEIVIPWRAGCRHRERALGWVLDRYHAAGFDTTVAKDAGEGAWSKAKAVTPAVEACGAEVVVVADADVWCAGIAAACTAVLDEGWSWAIPHRHVRRLTEHAAAAVLAGGDLGGDLVERSYAGKRGGGIVVVRRDVYLEAPLDARFEGWGREDEAWGAALTVLFGEPWRGEQPLWHLWHPPQQRPSRSRGDVATEDLYDRYRRARRHTAMRELVDEAKAVNVCP